jgi:predicted  nucleic acid-binding Zn-ribbon protein
LPVGKKENANRKEFDIMAIYHLHIKILTRGIGKSAVGAAAYRSGDKLYNEYDGVAHDFGRKGGIVHTEIFLPEFAPREYIDRNTLWNAVEKIEKQKNSQLAREIEVALPVELTLEQNLSILRKFVTENFVNAGMVADVCVHTPNRETPNPHAHIMLTMRPFNEDKTWGAKIKKVGKKPVYTTDWNDRERAEEWRSAWAAAVNDELYRQGFGETIYHRSYERQGVDKIPTVHLGVSATQMERRGIKTERGDINRAVAVGNSELKQLRARILKTKSWLNEQRANTPPTLYEVLSAILNPDAEDSQYKKIASIKLAAKTLVFIQENNISNLPALADKVNAMHGEYTNLSTNIKKTNKRIDTLKEHLRQSENYKQYRKIATEYDTLHAAADTVEKTTGLFAKSKAENARKDTQDFYRDHDHEIGMFRDAEKYLRGVLQSRFDPKKLPPIKMWQNELAEKLAERDELNGKYYTLKDEIKHVETRKRFAVDLMIPDEPREVQQQKTKTLEVDR